MSKLYVASHSYKVFTRNILQKTFGILVTEAISAKVGPLPKSAETTSSIVPNVTHLHRTTERFLFERVILCWQSVYPLISRREMSSESIIESQERFSVPRPGPGSPLERYIACDRVTDPPDYRCTCGTSGNFHVLWLPLKSASQHIITLLCNNYFFFNQWKKMQLLKTNKVFHVDILIAQKSFN